MGADEGLEIALKLLLGEGIGRAVKVLADAPYGTAVKINGRVGFTLTFECANVCGTVNRNVSAVLLVVVLGDEHVGELSLFRRG